MAKNSLKIKAGISALARKEYEITSGTIVPGSTDETACTVTIQPSDGSGPIEGVMLNAVADNPNGMILFPKDNSHVVISSIDGPGEWTLLRASEYAKAIITIDHVKYEIDNTQVNIQNGSSVFNVGTSRFKMNTPSESLFQLLKDCFTYLTELTVTTSSGTSSPPVNIADFTNLLTRLNNLLTS